jgi:adenine C2-methylase RlmN of 23S rRNA A2503 and tRNA A37
MKIQSLSVVVPNNVCINKCKFCVSRLNQHEYENLITSKVGRRINEIDFKNRMEFARDNHCNNVMLTGSSEPQQNKRFLSQFANINRSLPSPFKSVEMQTTGTIIDENFLLFLREDIGVITF